MRKRRPVRKQAEGKTLYDRADAEWSKGRLRAAFHLFRAAAERGFTDAYCILGNFYDIGTGVRRKEDAALYWYGRAYRRYASSFAANNIGCILRGRRKLDRALFWFRRAVHQGDPGANLNIGLLYLRQKGDLQNAIRYLRKVARCRVGITGRTVTRGKKKKLSSY